ncbi:MAG: HD domain-containing phosphohydrolase [bacterium]
MVQAESVLLLDSKGKTSKGFNSLFIRLNELKYYINKTPSSKTTSPHSCDKAFEQLLQYLRPIEKPRVSKKFLQSLAKDMKHCSNECCQFVDYMLAECCRSRASLSFLSECDKKITEIFGTLGKDWASSLFYYQFEKYPPLAIHSIQLILLLTKIFDHIPNGTTLWGVLMASALCHDIGLLEIFPNLSTISAPRRFNRRERSQLVKHIKNDTLKVLNKYIRTPDLLEQMKRVIGSHHESYTYPPSCPCTYPGTLFGNNIPFDSRLIACAEVYISYLYDTPWRRGIAPNKVVSKAKKMQGSRLDPLILKMLLRSKWQLAI